MFIHSRQPSFRVCLSTHVSHLSGCIDLLMSSLFLDALIQMSAIFLDVPIHWSQASFRTDVICPKDGHPSALIYSLMSASGWGRNSSVGSVLGLLSCLMQRRGFDPPLGRLFFFPVEEIFPSEFTWVLTPPPPPSLPPPQLFRMRV